MTALVTRSTTSVAADLSPSATHIYVAGQLRDKEQIRSIPGARWDRTVDRWKLPLSWSSCLALRGVFGDRLEIRPDLQSWATRYRDNVITPLLHLRDKFELPGVPRDSGLFPHQQVDIEFMTTAQKCLLVNDPGCGKSRSTIESIKKLHNNGVDVFPALIVCPSSVKMPWAREFAHWWPDGPDVQVVSGSAAARKKQLLSGADVMVMNYESVRSHSKLAAYGSVALRRCVACGGEDSGVTASRCHAHHKTLNEIDFRTVVADECHRLKSPVAQQTRALMAAAEGASVRIGVTGTPIANSLLDLWPLLHFIDPEQWPSKVKWSERYLEVMHNMWGGVVMCSLKPQLEGEFRGAIDPVMRRVPLDAVVHNLPDIVYERRDVTMSPKQAAAYRSMSDRLIAQLDTGVLVAASPLTAMLRMLQLSSSYGELDGDDVPGEDPAKLILTDPSSKLDAFMDEYMEGDFGDRSVVVFAVSRQLIEMLSARLDKAGVAHGKIVGGVSELNRQMSIDDFQEGKTKIILLTLSAGGTGITLTAGSVCVMLQRSWSMIEHKQALARCRRIGSEIHDTITHVDYVAPGTVEELVIAALDDKGIAMEDLVHDAELLRSALESMEQ